MALEVGNIFYFVVFGFNETIIVCSTLDSFENNKTKVLYIV